MQLRRVEKWLIPLIAIGGAALSPGTIAGDTGRTLATFLGLVSASILPTVSLLVNSMTASGRSVLAINELEAELQKAMDALFLLFGAVGGVVGALVALAAPPPDLLTHVPYLTTETLPRLGQAVVFGFSGLILSRVGQIPAILRRSLEVRHRIAVEEARRKTLERAPNPEAVRESFPTSPDFGKSVSLQEIQGRGPH